MSDHSMKSAVVALAGIALGIYLGLSVAWVLG
jgi:hypothetical protein